MPDNNIMQLILQLGALGGMIYIAILLVKQKRAANGNPRLKSDPKNPTITQVDCLRTQQQISDTMDEHLEKWGNAITDRIAREFKSSLREHELTWHADEVSGVRRTPTLPPTPPDPDR